MSPSQDPTSPTRDRKRRPDRGVAIRPLLWIVGVGLALFVAGVVIASVSPISAALWSWETVASLLSSLGLFVVLAIPGALVALRHPWGDGLRLALEKRYAHPRLLGLLAALAGLAQLGVWAATYLIQFPSTPGVGEVLTPAVGLVEVATLGALLALGLFDRRR